MSKKLDGTSLDALSRSLYARTDLASAEVTALLCNAAGNLITATKLIDNLGAAQGLKFVDGKPRISSMPYTYDIAEGNVSGHQGWSKIGFCATVGVTRIDVAPWMVKEYVFPTTTSTMTIVSSNANDNATGSGARIVTVYYLTEGFVAKTATVTLLGLTATTIALDMFRVNNCRISTCGVSNSTIGNLTIASGGVTYGYISAGRTRMRQCVWTVPTNTTLYVTQIAFSSADQNPSKPGGIRFTTKANFDNLSGQILQRGLFMPYNEVVLYNSAYIRELNPPTKLGATVDLKVAAESLVADTGDVTCSLRGWTEPS